MNPMHRGFSVENVQEPVPRRSLTMPSRQSEGRALLHGVHPHQQRICPRAARSRAFVGHANVTTTARYLNVRDD